MIKITYKGKTYNSLLDAGLQAIQDAALDLVKESIAPFEKEIEQEGGTVTIEVGDRSKPKYEITLKVSGISDDLKKRITAAVYSSKK
jgi:hypothetical protein